VQALREAQGRAEALQAEVRAARARQAGWSPEARQFAELEAKIASMERAAAEQAAQWQALLGEGRRCSELQLEMQRKKWFVGLCVGGGPGSILAAAEGTVT
jgi:hypothetical protein